LKKVPLHKGKDGYHDLSWVGRKEDSSKSNNGNSRWGAFSKELIDRILKREVRREQRTLFW